MRDYEVQCNRTEIESHLRIDILTVTEQELRLGQVLRHARRGNGAGVELRNVLAEIERHLNERCLAAVSDRATRNEKTTICMQLTELMDRNLRYSEIVFAPEIRIPLHYFLNV